MMQTMHWIITQISLLPWWAPGIIALSIYWIPLFIFWPFHAKYEIFSYTELYDTAMKMAIIPFYILYILSRTVEQLAELAFIFVCLGVLGALAAIIPMTFFMIIDGVLYIMGYRSYNHIAAKKAAERITNMQRKLKVVPGLRRGEQK